MATLKPFASNPVPFGFVTVATAGTTVRLTSGFTDLSGEGFAELRFTTPSTNTNNMYILSNSSAADKSNFTNVILVIPANTTDTIPKNGFLSNAVIPSTFFLDADTNGNKVFVSGFQL